MQRADAQEVLTTPSPVDARDAIPTEMLVLQVSTRKHERLLVYTPLTNDSRGAQQRTQARPQQRGAQRP